MARPSDYTTELAAPAYIYGLYDADGNLRYIGKANCPDARLASHMRDSIRRDTPVYRWIRKNGRPEMRVLEANCVDWKESERRLISEARSRGDSLLNVAEGGDEPHCPKSVRSENARNMNRVKNANPERAYFIEIKRKLALAYKRGWARDETVDKMRELANIRPDVFASWADLPYRSAA